MRKYFFLSCCLGLFLFCWLCPQFAEGQFGALEKVLNGKDKDKEAKKEPPKKGGGVFGFGEALGILFEDSATTLGIATQESQLKSYATEGRRHEQNRAWNDAIASYKQAVEVLEDIRSEAKKSDIQESLVAQYLWVYTHLVKLCLQLNQPEEAFSYAERSKARSFLDQLAEGGADIRKGVDPALLAEEQALYAQLEPAWDALGEKIPQYDASKSQTERETLGNELTALQQEIDRLNQSLDRLQRTMRYRNPRYAELKYPQPITLHEVQSQLLQDGESVLEYFWGDAELYLFVIGHKDFHALTIPLKEPQLTARIEQFLTPFRTIGTSLSLEEALKQLDLNLAYQLYQDVVQPAESFLQGTHTLLIVPDGALHYLPFEMVVTQPPAAYLIQNYAIVYAPSASVLKPEILYYSEEEGQPTQTCFALAPFHEKSHTESAQLRKAFQNLKLSQLASSEQEVKTIVSIFPSGGKYLLGAEATESAMRRHAGAYRYVHVATHGLIDPKQAMYSGIALYDDALQAYEIFNMELHADLVALSACETGLGTLKRGEGLVGLTRAFMYAGTPSVLVSLWSVSDESTAILMTAFYRNLQSGQNKVEALRQAKLALMQHTVAKRGRYGNRDITSSPYAHPFFWAPFVLSGDWR